MKRNWFIVVVLSCTVNSCLFLSTDLQCKKENEAGALFKSAKIYDRNHLHTVKFTLQNAAKNSQR